MPVATRLIAVPCQMDFANRTKLSRAENLARLLQVGHAALLHPNLHDHFALGLRRENRFSLGQIMCQRLFDVDMLTRSTGIDGDRHMVMVGRGDEDRINVLAVEQGA